MVKDLKEEPETPQQINRVEKVEINVGSGVNWLVLIGLVAVGVLLVKVNELEWKLSKLKS